MSISDEERRRWHNGARRAAERQVERLVAAYGQDASAELRGVFRRIAYNASAADVDALVAAFENVRAKVVAELVETLEGVYVGDPRSSLYIAGKKDGYLEAAGTVRHHYDDPQQS